MNQKQLIQTAVGLGVLFATVWVIGKAWRKSQNSNFSNAVGGQRGTKKENPCENIVVYDCPKRMGLPTNLVQVGGGCACPTEL